MAITSSAKRAIRTASRRHVFNLRRLDTMRDDIKSIKKMVAEKKFTEAEKALSQVYKSIDKAAKSGVIKKNTAARMKSRLSRSVAKVVVKGGKKKA